jgi:hypothetical protein
MRNVKQYIRWAFFVLAGFGGMQACTKTEYKPYEKVPLNKVLSYKVTNAQQNLQGAIDNVNNTITVLVPYYLGVSYLVADIQLDEGARLLDSTGVEINLDGGLEPVLVGATVKYIVESKEGEKRPYTLVQKITPHGDALKVSITGIAADCVLITKPTYGRLVLLGNFESTSRNAKFTLKNRATGEVHTDYMSIFSNTPGAQYTLLTDISPQAKAGEYDVTMEHQGRTVNLPALKLFYQRPLVGMFSSSSQYAPGDTIVFPILRLSATINDYCTVLTGLTNMYMKIGAAPGNTNLPANFPASLLNTRIPMKVVSNDGATVKAIFPEIPAGVYIGAYTGYGNTGKGQYYAAPEYGICFYGDFGEPTNFGNDVFIASQIYSAGGFTVMPKQQ